MSNTLAASDSTVFRATVLGSSLLAESQYDVAIADLEPTADPKAIAKHLIRKELITKYQAERLLAGRTDGFVVGQYRILDELGRGGMGRVYKALHTSMSRLVAMKVISQNLLKTEKARDFFQREVLAVAKLIHPNIVTAYDARQSEEICYLVMEFVDAPTLADTIRNRPPMPFQHAVEIIRQTAAGLSCAHALEIVHRDIKPSNLLVQNSIAGPLVKIVDFGLARLNVGDEAPKASSVNGGAMVGTAEYISPEQARNYNNVDARSDIYSLGCTFYLLVTGSVPFPGGTSMQKALRHLTDQPVPVRQLRPDTPPPLAAIIERMLQKKPEDRFQSCLELLAALEGFGGPISSFRLPSYRPMSTEQDFHVPTTVEDPWANLADPSSQTLASVDTPTGEQPAPKKKEVRKPYRKQAKHQMIWITIAVLVFCLIVAGIVGVVLKKVG
ncbi:MAG: serine/threonine-protein kinase [Zavarzinella sp.]